MGFLETMQGLSLYQVGTNPLFIFKPKTTILLFDNYGIIIAYFRAVLVKDRPKTIIIWTSFPQVNNLWKTLGLKRRPCSSWSVFFSRPNR